MRRINVNAKLSNIVAAGRRALVLATEKSLEPHLPEGTLATLQQEIDALTTLMRGAYDVRTGVRSLTGKQYDVCTRAYRRVSAIRKLVVRQTKNLDARRAYGVGERLSRRVVREVVHSLQIILARIEARPEEAKSFGFTEGDVTTLRALMAEVTAVDAEQEKARVTRPLSTRDRNAAARRVALLVGLVSGRGILQFADDDAKRAEFEALVSFGGRPPNATPPETGGAVEAAPAEAQPAAT